jgi:hypothetical protein
MCGRGNCDSSGGGVVAQMEVGWLRGGVVAGAGGRCGSSGEEW